MNKLQDLSAFSRFLPYTETMPVLFLGHGSPMNAIEDNIFVQGFRSTSRLIPFPKAIVCISAHWETRGTFVTAANPPKTIHDFGGFPDELFKVQYPAPGNPLLAEEITRLVTQTQVELDYHWGLDHGAWSVIKHLYPQADIPVIQLSLDYRKSPHEHYSIAKELQSLRNKGILIIGSGNMVHNLSMVAWNKLHETDYAFDWAMEANNFFKNQILAGNHGALMNYQKHGRAVQLAVPTPEHFIPLIYTLGLKQPTDQVSFINDHAVGGSLTMTSVIIKPE